MATQRENEEDNRLSRRRQQIRRKYNSLADNLFIEEENKLEKLREYVAFGGITSSKEKRFRKNQIDQLEEFLEKGNAELDRREQLELQQEGAGLPRDTNNTSRPSGVSGNRRDVSQESRIEMPTFGEREREAEIFATNLNYNQPNPTLEEREREAGLTDTTSGREGFNQPRQEGGGDLVVPDMETEDQFGTIGIVVIVNNRPHAATVIGQMGSTV